MNRKWSLLVAIGLFVSLCFVFSIFLETSAWARVGGGGSYGSRGSRSYSTPSTPSSPSPTRPSTPGPGYATPGPSNQPSSGSFSRSPFLQGLAGGVAGGFLGNMLFGGSGHASPMGGGGGGGIGFFDIIILGLLGYFGFKFYRRWQQQKQTTSFYGDVVSHRPETLPGSMSGDPSRERLQSSGSSGGYADDLEQGLDQIRRIDPNFDETSFKELVQDMFFRIQAGWMNRSLEGIERLLTPEMSGYFQTEFNSMKQQGTVNRLENIAVRKVEISEAWQEAGKDYLTVLFTANLLDYTVDDKTGQVVKGDKLNPVKFQEFWTFCRDVGGPQWQLSAINQPAEPLTRH
jgi:predicted lipid-binding transport protein (Tim44 family)